ncbi:MULTISPECIES: hypothetical protein [Nannocystis]|uniref:Uncharacterized protein n=1 Tax=Nannocystis radixulma TaxID=2995305 RepID=A0ABT5AX78_9BACT|nr:MULTISPECIES: hypothetical protein [Nannocystis]MCY1054638.1 hypothetical protein [Nannocystis sp. SCPEA4]MDC0666447.1 hypothetical protein [Nannocystis radixulma]
MANSNFLNGLAFALIGAGLYAGIWGPNYLMNQMNISSETSFNMIVNERTAMFDDGWHAAERALLHAATISAHQARADGRDRSMHIAFLGCQFLQILSFIGAGYVYSLGRKQESPVTPASTCDPSAG